MMKVHFVLHETFEVPGAYLKWAQERGHQVTTTKVYENEALPETVDEIDFLIVMGGPQSPDEDREAFPYFDPQAEIELIQKAMKADRYIVGVCLGAQLLSVAYGAKYEHSPEREIGVYPVTLTSEGLTDPHVGEFGETFETGHWHGDMPGLTEAVDLLIAADGEAVLEEQSQNLTFVQKPEAIRAYNYREMNAKLFAFLDSLTK